MSDSTDIKKAGILRKLKTMKKKYFVLRTESDSGPARLEYYDSEKKFKASGTAKRTIHIKTCFNINRKIDAKHKLAIALYTKDDCFSVVADSEDSLEDWLNAMLELQLDSPCLTGGAKLKPKFEHVWQVTVGDKSLASSRNMKGLYRLCLTPSSLTLVKVDPPETLEFSLMSIRRCGHTNNYFVIELGRSSITGAGELWLETEDVVIAQNMHEVTLNAMKSCREHEDFGSFSRPRSASNSENSRPSTRPRPVAVVSPQTYGGIRDRCDSLPSRPRTISEGQENNNRVGSYFPHQSYMDSLRPYGVFSRTVSYSPPTIPNPLSPVSATCSTDSAGSSLSIDDFDGCQQTDFAHGRYIHNLPTDGALHTEPPIKEEQLDEYVPMSIGSSASTNEGYLSMSPMSTSAPTRPSAFLHLNSTDSVHNSSLPPISQSADYMDMKSPKEGYISMSPLGAQLDTHSNSSSLDYSAMDGQTRDGYIHMAPILDHSGPPPQNEGYLDMTPLSSSLPKTLPAPANQHINTLSFKDSCSKLSETVTSSPSSTNLEDFPLDKVKSLLADTDDGSFDSYIRPVRAYSMGSRPQPKKSHISLQVDGSRIRAYSVGSQHQRKTHHPTDRDIGNLMKMEQSAGNKSSSAPLLNNRLRTSTSRGDVGQDLMEIDYNKSKYSSSMDCDSFTIEPVGRARSGSYSSSSSSSTNNVKQKSFANYLSMSPLTDQAKRLEAVHPPGDYVSLDPSCTYNVNQANDKTNIYSKSQQESKSHSYIAPTLSRVNSCAEDTAEDKDTVLNGDVSKETGYMCMSYEKKSDTLSSISSTFSDEKQISTNASFVLKDKQTSKNVSNFVPKTPPPSPSYGPHLTSVSNSLLVDGVVHSLSQPSEDSVVTSSGEIRLNYASLDLAPPSEEDGKSKLKKEDEAPLTYAQIDFSPVHPKVFQESESLSHL